MNIKIYTTSSSESSRELKKYLEERGLQFEEKLVDLDMQAREEMEKEMGGFMGVPLVVFSNGEKVIGFNRKKIDSILEK